MSSFRTTLLASLATALIGFAAPAFAGDSAYILQTGSYGSTAVHDQSGGDGNYADSFQTGYGHSASITQVGDANSGNTTQIGNGSTAGVTLSYPLISRGHTIR